MNERDRVFAKCAWRLIPFMGLLYLASYIDRVNAGFAALTMNKDLGFSRADFGFGAGIFFVGYLIFQIPSNIVLSRVGARRWISAIVTVWGAISAATAFVQGTISFDILRFLLGFAEAGLFPGVMVCLTLWFPQAYRARFAAAFICAVPVSGIIGGPLSALLLQMNGVAGLRGWQWLFLIEGLPAVLLGLAVLKFLPDGPKDAPWLTETEKNAIAVRLSAETAREPAQLSQALRNPYMLAIALAGFGSGCSLYATSLWLPQIVSVMGFSTLATGFVVAFVYAISMGAILAWGYSSDRHGERFRHVAIAWLFAASGFGLASVMGNDLFGLLGLICAVAGTQSAISPYFTSPSIFLRGAAVAGGIGMINIMVSLGGFVGPTLVGILSERSGDYRSGMVMLCGLLVLGALTIAGVGRAMAFRPAATLRTEKI